MEKMVKATSKGRMISNARKAGYTPSNNKVVCPKCTETAEAAMRDCHVMQSELCDRTINQVPWIDVRCAIVFYPQWKKVQDRPTLHACACGWRKFLDIKIVNKCAGIRENGKPCTSILTSKDGKHTFCAKCRKEGNVPIGYNLHQDLPEVPKVSMANVKLCPGKNGKICGKPVTTPNRKYCTTCSPSKTEKEEASKSLII